MTDTLYIAAADSSDRDKENADFVCTGKNDQDVFQEALDRIYQPINGEIRGGKIFLAPGNYRIDAFPRRNSNGRAAVMSKAVSNRFAHIGILFAGSERTESTVIQITKEAYDSVGENESCSLFATEGHNGNHHIFRDIYVTVYDDRKNIICFDGRFMGSLGMRRCKCLCETRGNYSSVKSPLPVEGFIAFMGTYGSNNMFEYKWEFCQAEGFGQGFAVGAEHLLLNKCAALFGRYGLTVNNYEQPRGVYAHPITILKFIDEANAFLWKFALNKYKQCVNAYNTSFEAVPHWLALGKRLSFEERPGDYCGHIDYVANQGYFTENDPAQPFWEKGSGINFETVNNTHKKVCTSAERRGYAANIGQEVFDTDLKKKLIFTGEGWFDMLGNPAE
ncbi:MAG: hypothetical protein IJL30_09220 [Clostridia bacterium]|nr:hypothetical protein [Clostridia bacterium]